MQSAFTRKSGFKKKAATMLAVILALGTLIGGAYAWMDFSQHASNQLKNKAPKYEVKLIEDFDERDDWTVIDGEITKEISVKNTGIAPDYGPVYVRIQLKEYMEIVPLVREHSPERYMIDVEGDFIVYECGADSPANAQAALTYFRGRSEIKDRYDSLDPRELTIDDITFMTNAVDRTTGFFLKTKEHDPNGQYGKYVILEYDLDESKLFKVTGDGIDRADQDANKANKHDVVADGVGADRNGECDYLNHLWYENAVNPTEEYVAWLINTGSVVLLSDWDGAPTDQWIIDDRDGLTDAWIYWGEALLPGVRTENFLNAVELTEQPNGSIYYAIHTELQALSIDEFGGSNPQWQDAPDKIIDSFIGNSASVSFIWPAGVTPPINLKKGETMDAPEIVVKPESTADKSVTWDSGNKSAVTVDSMTGKITAVGPGRAIITAYNKDTGKKATYTVNVSGQSLFHGLQDLIGRFDAENPDDYTADSYNAVKDVVDDQRGITDGDSDADIQAAIDAINAVYPSGLVSADKIELMPPDDPDKGYYVKDENSYNPDGSLAAPYNPYIDGRLNVMRMGSAILWNDNYYEDGCYGFVYLDAIIKDYVEGTSAQYSISDIVAPYDADPANVQFLSEAVFIGQRNGKDAILVKYIPSRTELRNQIVALGETGEDTPEATIPFKLNKGMAYVDIKITAVYLAFNA